MLNFEQTLNGYRLPHLRKQWDEYTIDYQELLHGKPRNDNTRFINGSLDQPSTIYRKQSVPLGMGININNDQVMFSASETLSKDGETFFAICFRQAEGQSDALFPKQEGFDRVYHGQLCTIIR